MACHCQQDELYAAEREVHGGDEFESVADVQQWMDSLRDSAWFERNFPEVGRITVYPHARGMDAAGVDDHGMGVVPWWPGWGELLMLHELSHVLVAKRFGNPAHSPWFARIYLEAVYTYMGSESYTALREAFDRHGVDYDTDNMTPAGRFQL